MSQSCRKEERAHIEALLLEAISQWRPSQPRRWLAKYGGWDFEGRGELVQEYRAIRKQAEKTLKKKRY